MDPEVRLFTGLSLSPEMSATMEDLIEELRPLARIRWKDVSQLHITTKFIGKWKFSRISELSRVLSGLPLPGNMTISVRGLGFFPGPNHSEIVHARVAPNEVLTQFAAILNENLAKRKIPFEADEYTPHITLGRIAGINPWPALESRMEEYANKDFGSFEVSEHHLYESTPAGYRQRVTLPLSDISSTL